MIEVATLLMCKVFGKEQLLEFDNFPQCCILTLNLPLKELCLEAFRTAVINIFPAIFGTVM